MELKQNLEMLQLLYEEKCLSTLIDMRDSFLPDLELNSYDKVIVKKLEEYINNLQNELA